jgi:uncharacterized repeat protein (TIGR03833 family)
MPKYCTAMTEGLRIMSLTYDLVAHRSDQGQSRKDIRPGLCVEVVLKKDQRTGKRTRGIVKEILTSSANHPHGIKVRLQDGQVGRVQEIVKEPCQKTSL